MTEYPTFPDFKPLGLEDRESVRRRIWDYQPTTSELTFANLFIWRTYYRFQWCLLEDCLLILADSKENGLFAMTPVGPAPRRDVTYHLLSWLRDAKGVADPFIDRADERLVHELEGDAAFASEPLREHFDYVYKSQDLISLEGRDYHGKRNHIYQFQRSHEFSYSPLTPAYRDDCIELAELWCKMRQCQDDMSLIHEFEGIQDTLRNFDALGIDGGVILIDEQVEAFGLGERLNEQTAVIHIEKANPNYRNIYAVINQQFAEHRWGDTAYINREQDLGIAGLRKAKMSYQPDHLEKKYRVHLV